MSIRVEWWINRRVKPKQTQRERETVGAAKCVGASTFVCGTRDMVAKTGDGMGFHFLLWRHAFPSMVPLSALDESMENIIVGQATDIATLSPL
jgi:hypothetical protein